MKIIYYKMKLNNNKYLSMKNINNCSLLIRNVLLLDVAYSFFNNLSELTPLCIMDPK